MVLVMEVRIKGGLDMNLEISDDIHFFILNNLSEREKREKDHIKWGW